MFCIKEYDQILMRQEKEKKQRQKWGFTYQIFRTIVKLKQSDAGQNHTYQ